MVHERTRAPHRARRAAGPVGTSRVRAPPTLRQPPRVDADAASRRRHRAMPGPSIRRGARVALDALPPGAVLAVAPLVAKTDLAAGHAVVATGGGAALYLGADSKTDGDEPYYAGYDYDTSEVTQPYTHLDIEGDSRLAEAARTAIRR